jgi:hypothetical protein
MRFAVGIKGHIANCKTANLVQYVKKFNWDVTLPYLFASYI